MSRFEDVFLESVPYKCEECGGGMMYKGGGSYECVECGKIALDAFGKVKEFLEKNGGAQPMLVIAEETGVPAELLNKMLKDGRLQIPPGCKIFLRCEKCGCAIRSGRFCTRCELDTFHGIQRLMEEEKNERKNSEKRGTVVNKKGAQMRFADKFNK